MGRGTVLVILILLTILLIIAYSNMTVMKIYGTLTEVSQQSLKVDNLYLCQNLLENITDGRWIRKIDLIEDTSSEEYQFLNASETEFGAHLAEYRIKRGIHTLLWRDDMKCGTRNLQPRPEGAIKWPIVGGWCDKNSDRPCCSDRTNGTCGNHCDCPACVDMRKIYHAEFSEWMAKDRRCTIRNYTAEEACEIVTRFSGIYFMGDSFVRKMFRAVILILRDDPTYGALIKSYNPELKERCVGADQFYWTDCRLAIGGIPQMLLNNSAICAGHIRTLFLDPYVYRSVLHAGKFLNYIKRLAGKEGTVILLNVGAHDHCNATLASWMYLEPALKYLDSYYATNSNGSTSESARWPQLIFTFPDTPGLLKSPAYDKLNGKTLCDNFAEDMKLYCASRKIPVLDFRKLTTGIHSYDGAHHGIGTNLMKVQLLLNYLDSFSKNDSSS